MLAGKKGLVLGVANKRSLAWACARIAAAEGAEVALTYQGERFGETVRELATGLPRPAGAEPFVLPCDVTRDEDVDRLADAVRERWERVDFVVHSIAYANPDELKGRFHRTSRAGFAQALDVSAYSLLALGRACGPLMPDGGSLVTMSYLGGDRVVPNYNVMGVAKAALDCVVRYLAWDLGAQGVRVNAVAPGPVRTLSASGVGDFTRMLEHVQKVAPLRRNVTADEVGHAVAFLCSDLSRAITGTHIPVDCGYSIMGVTATVEVPPPAPPAGGGGS